MIPQNTLNIIEQEAVQKFKPEIWSVYHRNQWIEGAKRGYELAMEEGRNGTETTLSKEQWNRLVNAARDGKLSLIKLNLELQEENDILKKENEELRSVCKVLSSVPDSNSLPNI